MPISYFVIVICFSCGYLATIYGKNDKGFQNLLQSVDFAL